MTRMVIILDMKKMTNMNIVNIVMNEWTNGHCKKWQKVMKSQEWMNGQKVTAQNNCTFYR